MGFYGKVNNLTNASLNFDKIYPNKFFMDSSTDMDSILIGRYVLVEYDTQGFYPEVTTDETNWYFLDQSTPIKFLKTGIRGFLIDSQGNLEKVYQQDIDNNYIYKNEIVIKKLGDDWEFYKSDGEKFIYITTISNAENLSFYNLNYELDKQTTNEFNKPFDSTVFVKTKKNEEIQYLAIAELNSVVPSFEIVPIPPSENPNILEFDKKASTNVLYKLKVQPQWGFRIAMDEDYSDVQIERTRINENGKTEYYNNLENKWTTEKVTIPAAIYFNSDGFDPEKSNTIDTTNPNTISVRPTGKSGNKYIVDVNENGEPIEEEAPDIQELSISLPIIGNTISQVWDIVYGEKRDSSEADSLVGKFNAIDGVEKGKILIKSLDNKLIGLNINGGVENINEFYNELQELANSDFEDEDAFLVAFSNLLERYKYLYNKDDDQWISTRILNFTDSYVDEPSLEIKHKILPDELELSDANILNKIPFEEDLQNGIIEGKTNILIKEPLIDKAGHVIAYTKGAVQVATDSYINSNFSDNCLALEHADVGINEITSSDVDLNKPRYSTDEEQSAALEKWENNINNITMQKITKDNKGHISQIESTKYILPHSYQTIKVNNDEALCPNGIQEELKIITDNVIQIDTNTDTIAFKHKDIEKKDDSIYDISLIKPAKAENETQKEYEDKIEKWKTEIINSFYQAFRNSFDEKGHVQNNKEVNLNELPLSYATVVTPDGERLAAKDWQDDLNIKTDEIIAIDINNTKDAINFSHKNFNPIQNNHSKIDLSKPQTNNSEVIEEWRNIINKGVSIQVPYINETGHITGWDTKQYFFPQTYSQFKVNGKMLYPQSVQDTVQITAVDDILNVISDQESNAIIFKHNIVANDFGGVLRVEPLVQNIGKEVNISRQTFASYQLEVDDAGHVVGTTPYIIKADRVYSVELNNRYLGLEYREGQDTVLLHKSIEEQGWTTEDLDLNTRFNRIIAQPTIDTTNGNWEDPQFTIFEPIINDAGHIVGAQKQPYIIPRDISLHAPFTNYSDYKETVKNNLNINELSILDSDTVCLALARLERRIEELEAEIAELKNN